MPKSDSNTSGPGAVKKRARARTPKRRAPWQEVLHKVFPQVAWFLKLIRDWTGRKPLWVRIPLYGLLVTGAIAYAFRDSLMDLSVVKQLRADVGETVDGVFRRWPVASGKEFAVAVAQIERDEKDEVAQSLAVALKISGVERLQIHRRLRFVDAANLDQAEADAHRTARRWLEKTRADLLFWGQVLPGGGIRLIMSLRNADAKGETRASQHHLAFTFLEETGEPLKAFEAAVQAQVLGFLSQFDSSRAVADQLRQAIDRLQRVVVSRTKGPGRDALVFALANSQVMLGEQAGDRAVLAQAVATYQELLDARARREVPLDWAMTQNNLGNALWSLGKLEGDVARWEQAQAAYRAAQEEYPPAKYPLEWAMTQNNLGLVLESLGKREGSTETIAAAAAAYRAGLERLDRKSMPDDWALLENNLGNALFAIGERETGTARLAEAAEAYQAALGVYRRDKAPLRWAMAQGNLANAWTARGEREKNAALLNQAVVAYRAALAEYPVAKLPLDWARTQSNLGTALGRLGELEPGVARLKEAVTALRSALQKRSRESAPLEWAQTQNNLGTALVALGTREKSVPTLDEAIRCFEAARSIPELKSAPRERLNFQNNLWRAEGIRADLAAAPPAPK